MGAEMTGLFALMAVLGLVAFLPIAGGLDSHQKSTREAAHFLLGVATLLVIVGVVGCAATQ